MDRSTSQLYLPRTKLLQCQKPEMRNVRYSGSLQEEIIRRCDLNKINLPDNAIIQALEVSFDGLHILDKHGNTLYINDACTRIEGTSKEEVQSKNIRQLIAEGVYSQSVTLMVLEKKASVTITQTTLNGKEILCTGTPVFDDDGEVEFVIVNSRDLTELSNLKH